jgi:endonuclease YncB( thermonuclease family)
LLAYVWLNLDGDPEPEMFNEELVKRGYARVYPIFPFDYLERFRRDEGQAQAQRLGLWSKCDYEPYSP